MKHNVIPVVMLFSLLVISCKSSTPSDNSGVKIATATKASGRVSLAVAINGVRQWKSGDEDQQKTVEADANYAFDLGQVDATSASGTKTFTWNNTGFGGTANWFTEFKKTYKCNTSNVTDIDSSLITFSSAGGGNVPGSGSLLLNSDGSYIVSIVGFDNANANQKTSSYTNCGPPTHNTSNTASGIPFVQYWTPVIGGKVIQFAGNVTAASPNRANGTYHGVDSLNLYSEGTTVSINLPIDITIIWDFSLQK